jgi:carbonic anhydrase/acetyltransferase-like protein (isoleucine patch superfamily)
VPAHGVVLRAGVAVIRRQIGKNEALGHTVMIHAAC